MKETGKVSTYNPMIDSPEEGQANYKKGDG